MGRVPEYSGDIFQAPEGSVIIHACNCLGAWGAGFALALREKFPAAYKVYRDKCLSSDIKDDPQQLVGTALLIDPQEDDIETTGRYWIACLFTSVHHGARKDKPASILKNTSEALKSLATQIEHVETLHDNLKLKDKLWTIRINAKAFRTPWEDTRHILVQSGLEVGVVNNLDIMSAADKKKTAESMEANGFDATAPPPFAKHVGKTRHKTKAASSAETDMDDKLASQTIGVKRTVSGEQASESQPKQRRTTRAGRLNKKG